MLQFQDQTQCGEIGNCLTACVATLLGIPISELPNHQGEDWSERWNEDLERYNAHLIVLPAKGPVLSGYSIVSGLSPRARMAHAIICFNGEMVHDPHEDRTGIRPGKVFSRIVIRPLDPSRAMGLAKVW